MWSPCTCLCFEFGWISISCLMSVTCIMHMIITSGMVKLWYPLSLLFIKYADSEFWRFDLILMVKYSVKVWRSPKISIKISALLNDVIKCLIMILSYMGPAIHRPHISFFTSQFRFTRPHTLQFNIVNRVWLFYIHSLKRFRSFLLLQ